MCLRDPAPVPVRERVRRAVGWRGAPLDEHHFVSELLAGPIGPWVRTNAVGLSVAFGLFALVGGVGGAVGGAVEGVVVRRRVIRGATGR